MRAALHEALGKLRKRMDQNGRLLYGGRWRTREEIRSLRLRARAKDFAGLLEMMLALVASLGAVFISYQLLILLFFP